MSEAQDLIAIKPLTAAMVFVPGGVDAILDKIEAEVRGKKTDISTPIGRKEIASLAYKVARSKTALDEMGKELAAEWKKKTASIDEERRTIRDKLDALKDEVRRPLTDWENAEKNRVAGHEKAIADIQYIGLAGHHPAKTAAAVAALIETVNGLSARDWQEFKARADETINSTLSFLEQKLADIKSAEEAAAELERLRAEERARKTKENEERIAAEAAEKARQEAEEKAGREAEKAAAAAYKERQRIERETYEANARARMAELARLDAIAKAEDDAKKAADIAERNRLAAIENERKRVADIDAKVRAEAAKREADKNHRTRINDNILAAMINAGMSEASAATAIDAIARGAIPHVSIRY